MGDWLRQARWALFGLLALMVPASAQTKNSAEQESAAQELLRQQERERILREKQETATDVRLQPAQAPPPDRLPPEETPCFPIERIWLDGEDAYRFFWSLKAERPTPAMTPPRGAASAPAASTWSWRACRTSSSSFAASSPRASSPRRRTSP